MNQTVTVGDGKIDGIKRLCVLRENKTNIIILCLYRAEQYALRRCKEVKEDTKTIFGT